MRVKYELCLVGCLILWGCASPGEDEVSIRQVRESSNVAIEAHDTVALAAALTPDYTVVTSRNAVSMERRVLFIRLAEDWLKKPDLVYRRTPERVDVNPAWRMAGETGSWVGTWTEANGEMIRLSGTYYAKWHNVDGRWLIRAEIFTPLRCEGGEYCRHSPI